MLQGIFFSILAGIFIALQSIFNARLGEAAGFWNMNAFVHGSGFIFALFILLTFSRKINISAFTSIEPHYLLGGVLGVGIIFSVTQAVTLLGISIGITIVIVTQILAAFIINYYGLFEEPIITVSLPRLIGLAMMIAGLVIYQLH